MKFAASIVALAAFVCSTAAQDAPAPTAAPGPAGPAGPAGSVPSPSPQCAAAVQKCLKPDASCVTDMCSACASALPCCAGEESSRLSCFQNLASAAATAQPLPTITNAAQLTGSVACGFAGVVGAACAAATTSFAALPTSAQASCLCYQVNSASSAFWAPEWFDGAVSNCAGFLAKAGSTSAAAQNSAAVGLCSKAGNLRSLPTLTITGDAAMGSGSPAETGSPAGTGDMSPAASTSASSVKTNGAGPAFSLNKNAVTFASSVIAVFGLALAL